MGWGQLEKGHILCRLINLMNIFHVHLLVWLTVHIEIRISSALCQMLHLLTLAGFALRLHLGHLACFHTTRSSNCILRLFLAGVNKREKRPQSDLEALWDQNSQSHEVQRDVLTSVILLNLWTPPALTDHINSWPWNKIHNASQKSLSQDLLPRSLFDVGTILGRSGRSSEPFVTVTGSFLQLLLVLQRHCRQHPCVCAASSICRVPFRMKSLWYCLSGWIIHKRMCGCFFIWWWANPQLTRITRLQKTRSQFQGRANNSSPCHCLY